MRLRRLAAAGAVAVLAAMGLGGVANATPTDPIQGDKDDATLTVHKYEMPAGGAGALPNNGTAQTIPGDWKAMNGIEFEATLVTGIDLTKNADWTTATTVVDSLKAAIAQGTAAANAWAPSDAGAFGTGTSYTKVTGADGVDGEALFSGLPIGLYWVQEVGPVEDSDYEDVSIVKALPFLVTVPMQNPDGNDWNYNVHVFPKNIVSPITKAVDDKETVQVGDILDYTITTMIPSVDEGKTIDKYVVIDRLPKQVEYVAASVVVKLGTDTLIEGANGDYTVAVTDATEDNGQIVTVTLTEDGRAKLLAAKKLDKDATLKTSLKAEVTDVGEIVNDAAFIPNEGSEEIKLGEGDKPVSKFGDKSFLKVNKDGDGLSGAKFQIYWTPTPVYTGAKPIVDANDDPVVVESGSDGKFTAEGLRYSDWAENNQLTCDTETTGTVDEGCVYYWLVETQAPDNYVKLAAPVMFKVNDETVTVETEIENVLKDDIDGTLPLTGMGGIVLLVGFGGLLMVGAGYSMYRLTRKKA